MSVEQPVPSEAGAEDPLTMTPDLPGDRRNEIIDPEELKTLALEAYRQYEEDWRRYKHVWSHTFGPDYLERQRIIEEGKMTEDHPDYPQAPDFKNDPELSEYAGVDLNSPPVHPASAGLATIMRNTPSNTDTYSSILAEGYIKTASLESFSSFEAWLTKSLPHVSEEVL